MQDYGVVGYKTKNLSSDNTCYRTMLPGIFTKTLRIYVLLDIRIALKNLRKRIFEASLALSTQSQNSSIKKRVSSH